MADNPEVIKTQETPVLPEVGVSPLRQLLKTTDVLVMLYPKNQLGYFSESIDTQDETTVYGLIKDRGYDKKSLVILLDTSGGNVYSAVKIMDTLRTRYQDVSIAIPQEAKSSGTMMCCGADHLIMSSISELGPLDKPMIHPTSETTRISALDIVKSVDGMVDIAIERQNSLVPQVKEALGLSLKECFEVSGKFVSELISPMLCREDAKIYNQAKRLLAIAEIYGVEFLKSYMFKNIKEDKIRETLARAVVQRLIWFYPDHSFAIRRQELRDLLFVVEDSENVPYWNELWGEYIANVNSKRGKIIRFL